MEKISFGRDFDWPARGVEEAAPAADPDPAPVAEFVAKEAPLPYVNLQALRWVKTLCEPGGGCFALLQTIACHADRFGCCWACRKTLARETRISLRSVSSHLTALEKLHLVRRIGRIGAHGGRIPSVLVLRAWPEREPIPPAGHPKLGPGVKEDPVDRLLRAHAERLAHPLPQGRATAAQQKKDFEDLTTCAGKTHEALERALAALGPWATAENWRHLEADAETLVRWLGEGVSLEHAILPVLEEMAARPAIPPLRSWRYFEAAIRARAGRPPSRR